MPKVVLAILAGLILLTVGSVAVLSGCQDDWCYVFNWQKVNAAKSFEDCARLGFPVQESYPRVCRAGDKSFTESVPAGTGEPPFATESNNIKVTSPRPNEIIGMSFTISGQARVFENVVSFRVKDKLGNILVAGTANAASPDTGQFGEFSKQVTVTTSSSSGTVEVFQASAKDGSDQDLVAIPVLFR
ncbi:MAG TPA: Gmad2 immunoglobulin-like domain-containing protein [Patescibacteria group bacterium]|nr:Gmad2 immunoglobulin-like domain-containing protein [Patescibacteria group bacterium]